MREKKYSLYMIDSDGVQQPIIEHEHSLTRVRNAAAKIRQRPGRTVMITRDNKPMPGGARALDNEAYQLWLEKHVADDDDGTNGLSG